MKRQTLIFDLDDTLIHCNIYFKRTIDLFVEQMLEWFVNLTKNEIKSKQLEIDLKSVAEHGLGSSRFPESLILTYKYFCQNKGRKDTTAEIERVRNIGNSVFTIEAEPYPYMYDVLNTLQKDGHYLYLFTGGDIENQSRKIVQLELETYFQKDKVFIFEHKNTAALEQVLKTINPDTSTTWMIGNSLKTDIKPAVELGINAVHIPAKLEWDYNNIEIDIKPTGKLLNVESLLDLPELFKNQ